MTVLPLGRRTWLGFVCLYALGLLAPAAGYAQQRDFNDYPEPVAKYLERIFDESKRAHAFREDDARGFQAWQAEARPVLCRMIGLEKIAASVGGHKPRVELLEAEDLGDFTRQRGSIESEPDVRIPFWLLKPKGPGPWPLGVFPHGHDPVGHDTSAGIYASEARRQKAMAEDRDVAVQAVRLGFVAVAPAVRGLSVDGVPDLHGRHGRRSCRSQLMHCLLVGRTPTGERVWDMQRILDWATALPEVDAGRVLMMGNSGGGMVTIYTAACDLRVTVAVPSCSFAPTVSRAGYIFHCDCNMVPGLLEFGDLSDVAGLIAPRHLLTVSGRGDALHSDAAVQRAATHVRSIYRAAGCPERYDHRWGNHGHRFYKDLMWPFVTEALANGVRL